MHWIVLALLVVTECLLVMSALQLVAALRFWLRWLFWLTLLLVLFVAADQASRAAIGSFNSDVWEPAAERYSLHAPYPTFRAFLFAGLYSIPAFWFLCGAVTLLRRSPKGIKVVFWELPPEGRIVLVLSLL